MSVQRKGAAAKVEELPGGLLNIAGAGVDSKGDVYFADTRENRICRYPRETGRTEPVRDMPQQPVQLVVDKAGILLVAAYTGNGAAEPPEPQTVIQRMTKKLVPMSLRPLLAAPVQFSAMWNQRTHDTRGLDTDRPKLHEMKLLPQHITVWWDTELPVERFVCIVE